MFNERRKIARRIINRVAQFNTDDGSLPRSCMISDISEGGARLYCETDMPQRFTLSVSGDSGEARRECRVVWRLGRELGVEFTTAAADKQPLT